MTTITLIKGDGIGPSIMEATVDIINASGVKHDWEEAPAGLAGGLGMIAGANFSEDVALFEAVHDSAPDIAGKGIANPIAVSNSGIILLQHIGENEAATRVEKAVMKVVKEGTHVTPDLNPQSKCGTNEMRDAIISAME